MIRNRIFSPGLFGMLLFLLLSSGCMNLGQDVLPPTSQATQEKVLLPTSTPGLFDSAEINHPKQEKSSGTYPEGTVQVQIYNHTGSTEENLVVKLSGYEQHDQIFEASESAAGGKSVNFSSVPLEEGTVYFADVEYHGAVYRSDLVVIESGTTALSLPLDIYGTTTNTASLSIDRIHIFLDYQEPEQLQVGEIFILSNYGDATVIAEQPGQPVLEFFLPEDAANLAFENGEIGDRFHLTKDGFSDSISIPPGSGVYQVMVFYTLPYQKNKLEFIQELNYPVSAVVVMTPVSQLRLKSKVLDDLGIREIQNGSIRVYSSGELERGAELQFLVSGKIPVGGQSGFFPAVSGSWLWLILGGTGSALILIGAVYFFRNQAQRPAAAGLDELQKRKENLMDSIIALDEIFDDGKVEEERYQERRSALKEQLRDVIKKLEPEQEND